MKKVLFLKNAIILTATALILRTVGIFFRVWLTGQIGAEGIGLYQVVFSVYVLASTFATSGICTAVTRIVAGKLSLGDGRGALRTVKISVLLSLFIAVISLGIIVIFAVPISVYLIKDERAAESLRVLALSLPFMGVCSCLRGYFLARRSAFPPSLCQIVEQAVRIPAVVILIAAAAPYGIAAASAAVMAGDVLSEMAGTVSLWLFYRADKRRLTFNREKSGGILKEILRIAFPISSGRYLHTGLRTAENILTPICLSKYLAGKTGAGLEQFGMIKGMAIPLLMFPASILSSVSTLLVPEMTEAMEKNDKNLICSAIGKVFGVTFFFSFLTSGIFFTLSGQIGYTVYKQTQVGYLLRALAPLVPFMYIDLISDGILKGLDQQNVLLRNNVIDSLLRIIFVWIFVPKYGMTGFLGVMIFSNIFTATLSLVRIIKITGLKLDFTKSFLIPFLSIFSATAIVDKFCYWFKDKYILHIIVCGLGITALYFAFMLLFGGREVKDLFLKKIQKTPK